MIGEARSHSITATEWLLEAARSYHHDAQEIASLDEVTDGMTGEQWAAVYRAVGEELHKCAGEVG